MSSQMSTPEDTVKGQPRKRRKITRSREGCLTCRRRRKLCSFDKPICEACSRLSLECKWPGLDEAGPSKTVTPVPQPPITVPLDNNWLGAGGFEAVIGGLFEPEFQLDESTLQMWAAVSLAAPGLSEINLDSGLAPAPPTPALPTTQDPQQLLEHFNNTLEQLCTVPGPDARRNIKALTSLAEQSATSAPAKALHLAILAWAGKHLWSQGEMQYETPADRAGAECSKLLGELLACFSADWPETERITLLAAVLMTIQFKVTKGDFWGYADYLDSCSKIAATVYNATDVPNPTSQPFYFYEHMLFLDAFSTRINRHRAMLDPAVVTTYSNIPPDIVMTWAGLSFPIYTAAHRTAALIRHRRAIPLLARPWSDHDLHDTLRAADELLREIGQSQGTMHSIINSNPHLQPHQHLHDAYRLAAQLNVRTGVLCEAPSSLTVRLLVRQLLAVLEYMKGHKLPGVRLLHWPMFQAAIASRTGGQAAGLDDRERSLALYKQFDDDGQWNVGLNVTRSLKLVQELWARSDGSAYVDWVDVLEQYDWELFLV